MVRSRVVEEDLRWRVKVPELGRISEPGKWGAGGGQKFGQGLDVRKAKRGADTPLEDAREVLRNFFLQKKN